MKLLLTLVLAFTFFALHSQTYEFGKVSEEEILEQQHATDPEATASVLYKKSKIYFEYNDQWQYIQEVEARIKIYKKEGFENATVQVPLYKPGSGSNEIFSSFKAYTYNLDGKKISKDRVRNDGQFQEDFNDEWMLEKFTFPNIKEGSVIEYSYKITSPYIYSLPWFYFQQEIPVDFAEYTIEVPQYLGYKTFTKGYTAVKQNESREQKKFTFRYVPTQKVGSYAKTEESSLNTAMLKTIYTAENVPKIANEDYLNNINNYLTSIKQELEWTRMPEAAAKNFTKTWDDVINTIVNSDRFGKELKEKNYFEADITPLLANTTSNQEKAVVIFEFLKNKMTWNGIRGKFTREGVKNAYKNNTGNVAEINLILTAMFRHAGLYANPVLLSTKDYGIPLFPTVDGFNYLVSSVEVDGQLLLFDATSTYSTPNVLPERTINWIGRRVRENEQIKELDLMPTKPSRRVANMEVKLLEGGNIEGKLRNTYTDYLALEHREKYAPISDTEYIESIEKDFVNFKVKEFSFQNKKDPYKPLIESYDFQKTNAFDQIDDKIFIQPSFFLLSTTNPFNKETRNYPIDFRFPTQETYLINILLPEGYKIESVPQSEIFELPNNLGDFKYLISQTENNIQIRINSNINSTIVPADFYKPLKDFFEAKVAKLSEKITLTKID